MSEIRESRICLRVSYSYGEGSLNSKLNQLKEWRTLEKEETKHRTFIKKIKIMFRKNV